jgi:hypothetical protein
MFKLPIILSITLLLACNTSTNSKGVQTTLEKPNQVASDHGYLGLEVARKQVKGALAGEGDKFKYDMLIKDSATAIAMAEPLLFQVYGENLILGEKPYEVYLIDGYWYISGTIPEANKGGGFEIIFSAKNGQIIRLTHYK